MAAGGLRVPLADGTLVATVVGDGAVGLLAALAAKQLGARASSR